MQVPTRQLRASAIAIVFWLPPAALGATMLGPERPVPVTMALLHIIDLRATHGRAKTVLISRDDALAVGDGSRPDALAARIRVEYAGDAAFGTFSIPRGTGVGWNPSAPTDADYGNRAAPGGPSQVKRLTLRAGRRFKMVALGVGDPPLDLVAAGPPAGGVYVAVEVSDPGVTTQLCALMTACEYVPLEEGRGARLTCRDGAPDPDCRAARPVYRWHDDVRYGGERTVAVLGDSITAQSENGFHARLGERAWYLWVLGTPSQMFREAQDAAVRTAASGPEVAVLHFGTNDFACYLQNAFNEQSCRYPDFDQAMLVQDARAMVAVFAPGTCVLGTTVWFGLFANSVNQLWRDMAAAGELRGIVPWGEHLASLPSAERDLLLLDSIGHLTAEGVAALTTLTADTVAAVCGS